MRIAFVAALLLTVAPALGAEAISYKGTLGGTDIVVELTGPDDGPVVGRYSYLKNGGDIPLDAAGNSSGIALTEQAPCTETTCVSDDDGVIGDIPVGAHWLLQVANDGSITGTWRAEGKAGKALPIKLMEIGRRALPDSTELTPEGLLWSHGDSSAIAAVVGQTYAMAKMGVTLEEGPVEMLEGSSFRYVSDPRTKFAFPRIVSLADGSSPDAANAALAQRHAEINTYAFDCLGMIYGGFGGRGDMLGMGAGTLGDYEDESVTMTYLSPTVMNWTEGGSTFCQGAYPNNHYDSYIVDVKTGAPFALGRVFKDWTATTNYGDYDAPIDQAAALAAPEGYGWSAGQPLIDYVLANRTPDGDADYESECGIEELINTNLGMRFAPGDQVIFSLDGLPHVIFACGEDLLTVKLSAIPQLLTQEALTYFPSLAQ